MTKQKMKPMEIAMSALRKILVVDDDPVVGKSFSRVLSGKGYAVITAADGEEALKKLATEDYDVVYTDIKMPGMSGLEVAERVKAKRPWTPVVIITGYGTAEHEARAKAAGVSGFLHKPLSPEMIEESAREAVAAPEPVEEVAEVTVRKENALKNIALFFAAPFIALAYIIAFPFVGLAVLAWMGIEAAAKRRMGVTVGKVARNTGLLVAAPFIALACLVFFPVIGLGLLAWIGGRTAAK
jgi:CheY-like chemotaxis protein